MISTELYRGLDDRVREFVPGKTHGTAPYIVVFRSEESVVDFR